MSDLIDTTLLPRVGVSHQYHSCPPLLCHSRNRLVLAAFFDLKLKVPLNPGLGIMSILSPSSSFLCAGCMQPAELYFPLFLHVYIKLNLSQCPRKRSDNGQGFPARPRNIRILWSIFHNESHRDHSHRLASSTC
jgi:hypothetical protein